tara:strand:+ start:700 stop:1038 length:339 start_codon:yes stop_codon:yes gene_type:complete
MKRSYFFIFEEQCALSGIIIISRYQYYISTYVNVYLLKRSHQLVFEVQVSEMLVYLAQRLRTDQLSKFSRKSLNCRFLAGDRSIRGRRRALAGRTSQKELRELMLTESFQAR